jgi:hypothetical protein
MMSDHEADELELLEQEVVESIRKHPERRTAQQRIRAAFAVADALNDLLEGSKRSIEDIAGEAGIDAAELGHILTATFEPPISVELLLRLSKTLGYRFEIQFFPAERLHEAGPRDVELTDDGIRGGVLVRFPSSIEPRTVRTSISQGVKRLALKADSQRPADIRFDTRASAVSMLNSLSSWPHGGASIGELVGLADSIAYKLQLRFVPATTAAPQLTRGLQAVEPRSSALDALQETGRRYKTILS